MIQQPELGNRILALRKSLDMTQEDLKNKCHVSVRTIQRIESGIVTPRLATIKILIEALGENPGDWQSPNTSKKYGNFIQELFLINLPDDGLKRSFQPAWISGVVYLLLFMINVGITSLPTDNPLHSPLSLIPINILMIVSFGGFIRGYIALARLFEVHLLKVSSYLSFVFVTSVLFVDIIEVSFTSMDTFSGVVSFFTLILMGASALLFGMALLRLQDGMGRISKIAGRLEIIFGISYLSIILSFIGLALLGPIMILEIVLLSKADQQVKNGSL